MDVDRTTRHSTLIKNHREDKTYILVKLSESLSNAIQEYSKPTIRFQGSHGAIKFPNGKNYDFSLEQKDRDVECIRQTKNRWESVGKVACCLHVKGKDDVYQRTRTKMAAAEKEKRKYCTKLLSSPNSKTPATKAPTIATVGGLNGRTTEAKSSFSLFSSSSSSSSSSASSSSSSARASTSTTATTMNHSIIFLSKYPDITDVNQLKRYKADFDRDYQEYQQLHSYLQRIEDIFRQLQKTLKQSVEGSPEWESAKEEIFNQYERFKHDNNFHRARSKYKQLYDKLAHIKGKILQFKRDNRDKCVTRKKRKRC